MHYANSTYGSDHTSVFQGASLARQTLQFIFIIFVFRRHLDIIPIDKRPETRTNVVFDTLIDHSFQILSWFSSFFCPSTF